MSLKASKAFRVGVVSIEEMRVNKPVVRLELREKVHHEPVLTKEILKIFSDHPHLKLYVDATLGAGGHAKALLKQQPETRLIGFDQDAYAREIASQELSIYEDRIEIKDRNFENLNILASSHNFAGVDGFLFDLGVSNMQLTLPQRGFSFNEDGPLDMRMNQEEQNEGMTAKQILSTYNISELLRIFREYGEEKNAYYLARGIVRHRELGGTLETTGELVALIRRILPAPVQRRMGGHPARRVFQALRIEVNDEMGVLNRALASIPPLAAPGCRVLFISYHSLEDRLVKRCFKKWRDEGFGKEINRKPIIPSDEEVEENNKSRSAKLRAFEFFLK